MELAKKADPFGFNPDKDKCDLLGYKSEKEIAFLIYDPASAGNVGAGLVSLVNLETETVKNWGSGQFPKIAEEYIESEYNQRRLAEEAQTQ